MTFDSDDARLRQLLRKHEPAGPVRTPDFRSAVWARIEARRQCPASWRAWLRLHFSGFAAAAAASVALAAGAGSWVALAQVDRSREARLELYVASIDPHRQLGTEQGSTGR